MIDHLNREEILRYLGYKDSGVTERIEPVSYTHLTLPTIA